LSPDGVPAGGSRKPAFPSRLKLTFQKSNSGPLRCKNIIFAEIKLNQPPQASKNYALSIQLNRTGPLYGSLMAMLPLVEGSAFYFQKLLPREFFGKDLLGNLSQQDMIGRV